MAKSNGASPGPGHNEEPQFTRAQYLEFMDDYRDADKKVADAVTARKDLRAKVKASGIPLAAFDRTRRDAEKSGAARLAEERAYQLLMQWQGMPVGYQTDVLADKPGADPNINQDEPPEHQRRRVTDHGRVAGKGGLKRDTNPWNPGTVLYALWDEGWMAGQEEIANTMAPSDAKGPKRPVGRPRTKGAAAPPANGASGASVLE